MNSILCPDSLNSSVIIRIDLNMDFSISFCKLIEQIDIKGKRNSITYTDESGARTGISIGKGAETIVIYDKSKKENLEYPLSRIELRLTGNKLPTRSFNEIQKSVQEKIFFESIIGIDLTQTKQFLTEEQSERIKAFHSISCRDGFFAAKKVMNQSRNFDRDFSKIVDIKNWQHQPKNIFKKEIKKFFKTQE